MILRNYYNMLAAYTMGVTSTDTTTFGDGHINWKDKTGRIRAFYCAGTAVQNSDLPSFGKIIAYGTQDYSGLTVQIGTGNTAVSFDDYELQAALTSGISAATFINGTPTFNSSTQKWTGTCSFLLTNSGSSAVTISEVGIFAPFHYGQSYSDVVGTLIYREVLSTPFTLAAGESVTYTQNFEFTMPTV